MTWVKWDDKAHRNPKLLAMSDAAHRIYTDALSYCGDTPDPTGFLGIQEALTFVRGRGKPASVIAELVQLNAWEKVADGYLVHDFEVYLPKKSTDRVRAFRERKRAQAEQNGTGPQRPSNGHETVSIPLRETGGNSSPHARAHPDPVPDPVPVTPKAPSKSPSPSARTRAHLKDQLQPDHTDLALQLAARISADVVQRTLTPLEVGYVEGWLNEYAYLSVDDMIERVRSHNDWCKQQHMAEPSSLSGYNNSLRIENDHRADSGAPKAHRNPPIASNLQRLSESVDRDVDPDDTSSESTE